MAEFSESSWELGFKNIDSKQSMRSMPVQNFVGTVAEKNSMYWFLVFGNDFEKKHFFLDNLVWFLDGVKFFVVAFVFVFRWIFSSARVSPPFSPCDGIFHLFLQEGSTVFDAYTKQARDVPGTDVWQWQCHSILVNIQQFKPSKWTTEVL